LATVIAKSQKRKRDAEKETVFFYHGAKITTEKIARFKRRDLGSVAVASPSAGEWALKLFYIAEHLLTRF
jgi:hypothetical protein